MTGVWQSGIEGDDAASFTIDGGTVSGGVNAWNDSTAPGTGTIEVENVAVKDADEESQFAVRVASVTLDPTSITGITTDGSDAIRAVGLSGVLGADWTITDAPTTPIVIDGTLVVPSGRILTLDDLSADVRLQFIDGLDSGDPGLLDVEDGGQVIGDRQSPTHSSTLTSAYDPSFAIAGLGGDPAGTWRASRSSRAGTSTSSARTCGTRATA